MLRGVFQRFSTHNLLAFFLFVLVFAIYFHNLSIGVYGGDAGDFLSAMAVHGIPHPSGYPLYTMLGILFSSLPLGQTFAWKVNLLSVVCSSCSVTLMFLNAYRLTKNLIAALIGATTLAFFFPFWLFSEVAEVFALHTFFISLLLYLCLRLYQTPSRRLFYLIFFVTGLSFTNQELTLLFLLSIAVILFSVRKKISWSVRTILTSFFVFFLGLLPYIYIPLAAAQNPPVNWDHASTWKNFVTLITRKDYGWHSGNIARPSTVLLSWQTVMYYLSYVATELTIFPFVGGCIGALVLLRQKKYALVISLILGFLLFGIVFFLYNPLNIFIFENIFYFGLYEKFYSTSMIFLILLFTVSLPYIANMLKKIFTTLSPQIASRNIYTVLFYAFFAILPLYLFFHNTHVTNLSQITSGDRLGHDILSDLPQNSYFISDDDNALFDMRYIEYTHHTRQDVTSYNPQEFLYAALYLPHIESVLHKDYTSDIQIYQAIAQAEPEKHFFIKYKNYVNDAKNDDLPLIPYGLVAEISTKPLDEVTFLTRQTKLLYQATTSLHFPSPTVLNRLLLISNLPIEYADAYVATGYYLIKHYHDYERAKPFFQQAIHIASSNDHAYEGLGDYYEQQNQCQPAEEMYKKTITYNVKNFPAYKKLYNIAKSCQDTVTMQRIDHYFKAYPHLFK